MRTGAVRPRCAALGASWREDRSDISCQYAEPRESTWTLTWHRSPPFLWACAAGPPPFHCAGSESSMALLNARGKRGSQGGSTSPNEGPM
eukprot:441067-Pyramimonas_sp.AAC.1